jgi:hypothetical protein
MIRQQLPNFALAAALALIGCRTDRDLTPAEDEHHVSRAERIDFLEKIPIGEGPGNEPPWITHLVVVDLDEDGLRDVVLSDATRNEIRWIRQGPVGTFEEKPVASLVIAPAHVEPADVDLDGDLDLLVAEMGQILPSNAKIGSLTVLENKGDETFENHVLLDNVARVSDVRAGDLDGDGDVDLVAGQFGYDDGEIRWLRNQGQWKYESERLLALPGTIHVPVADVDGDRDLDIVALVSQTWEQVYVFENDGTGQFASEVVYGATNEDFGSSGISLVDLDRDSDPDILYTNGDAFDYVPSLPRPWHGVQWLENLGARQFAYARIGNFPGAYSARAMDADGDGDLDIFAVSLFADWSDPRSQSIVWFENDGSQNFTQRDIDSSPSHLVVVDVGDLDGDGQSDLVSGGLYSHEPFDRVGRVTWWRNHWNETR